MLPRGSVEERCGLGSRMAGGFGHKAIQLVAEPALVMPPSQNVVTTQLISLSYNASIMAPSSIGQL